MVEKREAAYDKKMLVRTQTFLSMAEAAETAGNVRLSQPKTDDEIKEIMYRLGRVITYHNYAYYVLAHPLIADVQYDSLFKLLVALEEMYPAYVLPDTPTQVFTGQLLEGFSKVKHFAQLLSLENTYSAGDITQRCDRVAKILQKQSIDTWTYCVEPKYDGSSVELIYEYGRLVQASTRGDGFVGEDITPHIKGLGVIPHEIDVLREMTYVAFRGEAVLPKSAFEQLNAQQLKEHQEIFANPRNAVAGTLRQLDPSIAKKRGVTICMYELLGYEFGNELSGESSGKSSGEIGSEHHAGRKAERLENIDTQGQILTKMREWGLPVFNRCMQVNTVEELTHICTDKEVKRRLDEENILFDGLVIKVNEVALRPLMGVTGHHPRRAMAYKYPAQQVATQLTGIAYQVGRTGAITPVAELAPVQLQGSVVSKATLHNFDFIEGADIRVGDWVRLQKSGEVIPYIVGPIVERRTGQEQPLKRPEACPSCGTPLHQSEDGVALTCPSDTCGEKRVAQLLHFVSKQAMNIQGLGEQLVKAGVERGILQSWVDIFRLTDPQKLMLLRTVPGVAEKKLAQLVQELQRAKSTTMERFLFGLGIGFVGKKAAEEITKFVASQAPQTLDEWLALLTAEDQLKDIYGIGGQTVKSLCTFFSSPRQKVLLEEAIGLGVQCMFVWNEVDEMGGKDLEFVTSSPDKESIPSSDQMSLF